MRYFGPFPYFLAKRTGKFYFVFYCIRFILFFTVNCEQQKETQLPVLSSLKSLPLSVTYIYTDSSCCVNFHLIHIPA